MEELYISQNRIRQIFFLLCLLLLGALLARELSVFVPGFLGAITLYIIMRKGMLYLVIIKHWPKPMAAGLLMFLSFIIIMVPIGGFISMMSSKVT